MSLSMEKRTVIQDRDSARVVLAYLQGKFMSEEIDSAIESEIPDVEHTPSTGVESSDSKKNRAAWMRSNKKCIGYVRQHLTPDDSDAITDKTALQIIDFIKSKYILAREQTSLFDACQDITHLKVFHNDTWDKALMKINKMESSIGSLNRMSKTAVGNMGPSLSAGLILSMLPESFNHLKQSYMERDISEDTYNPTALKTTIESIYKSLSKSQPSQSYGANMKKTQSRESSTSRGRQGSPSGGTSKTCDSCGKQGHLRAVCRASDWEKRKHKEHMAEKTRADGFAAKIARIRLKARPCSSGSSSSDKSDRSLESLKASLVKITANRVALPVGDWIHDSGCAAHMTKSFEALQNAEKLVSPLELDVAAHTPGVNKSIKATVTHVGSVVLVSLTTGRKIKLEKVYWGPTVNENLVSQWVWDLKGFRHSTFNKLTEVFDESAQLLCTAKGVGGNYILDLQGYDKGRDVCTKNRATSSESMVWHQRLGHLNWTTLSALSRKNNSMPFIPVPNNSVMCLPCLAGKQFRSSLPDSATKIAEQPLALVHTDLCGPFLPSLGGAKYFMTFTDDRSRLSSLYFLLSKDQAYEAVVDFKKAAELETGHKWLAWRPDNAGELSSNRISTFLSDNGIQLVPPPAHTPALNGVSERLNRTINDKVRSMLALSKLPEAFWAEAARSAVFQKNRTPTRSLGNDAVPVEVWNGGDTDLKHIKVFGSLVTLINHGENQRKLEDKISLCLMLSYAGHGKYRLYSIRKQKIVIAAGADCRFFEDKFITPEQLDEISVVEAVLETDINTSTLVADHVPRKTFGPELPNASEVRIMRNQTKRGNRQALNANKVSMNDADKTAQSHQNSVLQAGGAEEFMAFNALGSPTSRKVAMSSKFAKQWLEAEGAELNNMKKYKVFKDTLLPDGETAIFLKWVYKLSLLDRPTGDAESDWYKFKARLVARGDMQKHDTYEETYAPVTRFQSIRLVCGLGVVFNLEIRQWDFIAAYLNSSLTKRNIYVYYPEGYRSKTPRACWLALQALYGLKQAGAEWQVTRDKGLKSLGWIRLECDHSVYYHLDTGSLVAIWVDDCILAASKANYGKLFYQLNSIFAMKDLGAISLCLGLQFRQRKGALTISQGAYVKQILMEYGYWDCNSRQTPFEPGTRLAKEETTKDSLKFNYRRAIGKLLYLSNGTRPDISYAVSQLSKFTVSPAPAHIEALQYLLRYLRGTWNLALCFDKPDQNHIVAYCDSDWGGDVATAKSTTGYIFMFAGAPISWMSKLQPTVALSSTEAEYMAAGECVKEAIWLTSLYNDLSQSKHPVMCMRVDNQGAMDLTKDNKYHGRTKHINLRHHFIREHISVTVKISWIGTHSMIADSLTKAVSVQTFNRNVTDMNLKVLE